MNTELLKVSLRQSALYLPNVTPVAEATPTTLLLVTHSSAMAKQFCKRGIVLYQSKVYFDGPIEEAIRVYEEDILGGKPAPKPKANSILNESAAKQEAPEAPQTEATKQ